MRRLRERGASVSVVMTEAARRFITPLTLQTLSGKPVASGLFDPAARWDLAHVELSELADLILIAPATAATISRLACGGAADLLSATVLGTRAPVLIAPAMSATMVRNPLFLENRSKLEGAGVRFVDTEVGRLASGRNIQFSPPSAFMSGTPCPSIVVGSSTSDNCMGSPLKNSSSSSNSPTMFSNPHTTLRSASRSACRGTSSATLSGIETGVP